MKQFTFTEQDIDRLITWYTQLLDYPDVTPDKRIEYTAKLSIYQGLKTAAK